MTATLAEFRTYHTDRGNDAPTEATDADANAALVRAYDHVRDEYVSRFLPAYSEALPDAVDDATYEAAAIELATPSFFSATYTEASAKVLTQVDGISWEFTGRKGGNQAPTSTKISSMLRPFMAGTSKTLLRV